MHSLAAAVPGQGVGTSLQLDRLDYTILHQMEQSTLLASNNCCERAGVPAHQITSRIRRLEQNNVVRTQALLNIDACGQTLAHFYIRVGNRSISKVAREVARLPATLAVAITRRNSHILATARVSAQSSCHELMEKISLISGVSSVSSELVLRQIVTHINHTRLESVPSAGDHREQADEPTASFEGLLDELDIGIVNHLQKNPHLSNRKIADEMGVSEGSIRYRLKKLQDRNLLKFVSTIDPNILGLNYWAWLKLKVVPQRLNDIVSLLKDSDWSKYIAVTTGDESLVCLALTGSGGELDSLVSGELLPFPGIRSVSASQVIANYKLDKRWGYF